MVEAVTTLRERQRERTRADILDAVVDVVASEEADGPLIEAIAARAGVSRATLYAHFPGGFDELVESAYVRAADDFIGLVRTYPHTSWQDRILAHGKAMLELSERGSLGRFYNVAAARFGVTARVQGAGSRHSHDDFVLALTEARGAGAIVDLDPEETAFLLAGMVRVIGVRAAESRENGETSLGVFARLVEGIQA
jgi:AcrR family transcriptional regulator